MCCLWAKIFIFKLLSHAQHVTAMQIFWNRDLLFSNLYSGALWGGASPFTCKIQSFFFYQLLLPSPLLVLNIFVLLRKVVLQGRDFGVCGSVLAALGY